MPQFQSRDDYGRWKTSPARTPPSSSSSSLFTRDGVIAIGLALLIGGGVVAYLKHEQSQAGRLNAELACIAIHMESGRALHAARIARIQAGGYGGLYAVTDRMDNAERQKRHEQCLSAARGEAR